MPAAFEQKFALFTPVSKPAAAIVTASHMLGSPLSTSSRSASVHGHCQSQLVALSIWRSHHSLENTKDLGDFCKRRMTLGHTKYKIKLFYVGNEISHGLSFIRIHSVLIDYKILTMTWGGIVSKSFSCWCSLSFCRWRSFLWHFDAGDMLSWCFSNP